MVAESLVAKKQKGGSQQNNIKENSKNILLKYCKNINDWPDAWEINNADIKTGKTILEEFKLFLIDKIEKGYSKKTIKTYAGYLWALGGELISQVNNENNDRQLSARNLILKYIDASGGLYWRHANNEADHARYDSTCKQLFKFITAYPG
jgi:hypothetical protein